jgi:hypothetical protein
MCGRYVRQTYLKTLVFRLLTPKNPRPDPTRAHQCVLVAQPDKINAPTGALDPAQAPSICSLEPTRLTGFPMLALTDSQLQIVMTAAGSLPVEKRSTFLERVAAKLRLRGPHFTDVDLGAAIQAALTGLIQSAA